MSDTPRLSQPAAPSNVDDLEDATVSMTEHRALKSQLAEAQQGWARAEQKIAAREQRLAALAHELRAQLASMLLHAQLLREGDTEDRPYSKRIGKSLERAVEQQAQLVNHLLNDPHEAAPESLREGCDSGGPRSSQILPLVHGWGADGDRTTAVPQRSLDRPGKIKPYEALKDIRILYIDDDFATREAVFEVLELTGARVALASSTADGMMALETFKPHVIVCDLVMPGEDGYAFMRKLRASEVGQASGIPVLAFTGRASAADKRDALAAGFQLYLSKPIDIDRLRDSVAQLVELIGTVRR